MTYPHGLFQWADISLPDIAAGREFYAELFGWEPEDQHEDDGSYVYTMFRKDGRFAAGLGLQQPGVGGGHPPMWQSYVAVDDVESAAKTWVAEGGVQLAEPMAVMDRGRMAVMADPQGAVLSLWEAGAYVGAEVFGEHGAMSWNELNVRDSEAARAFYGAVFGWRFEEFPDFPGEYWTIRLDTKRSGEAYAADDYNGGILTMDDSWPDELPAHWMVYFTVDDTDALVERLESLGGSVSVPAFDASPGRIAVVADPQGGTFSVLAPNA